MSKIERKIDRVEIVDVRRDGGNLVGRPAKPHVNTFIFHPDQFYFMRDGKAVRASVHAMMDNGDVVFSDASWLSDYEDVILWRALEKKIERSRRRRDVADHVAWFAVCLAVGGILGCLFL